MNWQKIVAEYLVFVAVGVFVLLVVGAIVAVWVARMMGLNR